MADGGVNVLGVVEEPADLQQIDEGLHTIGAVNSGEGEGCE